MPRKKKPPYKPEWDFDFYFDDPTLSETDGKYSLVKKLVESEFPYVKTWNIKTQLTISSPFGEGNFILDFRYTKNVYIINYLGSNDTVNNPDLSCLSRLCQGLGWAIPQPTEMLVTDNVPFWKHMWEVLLVDSPYLDSRYGTRKTLDMKFNDERVENEEEII